MNGFFGTLADVLKYTFHSDNDSSSTRHCASQYFGGWWFIGCYHTHLNEKYYSAGKMAINSYKNNILKDSEIHWQSCGFNRGSDFLTFTEMKVRRKL